MSFGPITFLLLALLVASCAKPMAPVEIAFAARYGDSVPACDERLDGPSLSDLRFYVSNAHLTRSDGKSIPISLSQDRWQHDDLALLDLEDGSGSCLNGTAETNFALRGDVPAGEYRGLRFEIGVPFALNHDDPLKASAPLANPTMHWHWRAGYKFLRAGLATEGDGFWIHIGSAGCEGRVGAITNCKFPNRVTVHLPDFSPSDSLVAVDFSEFITISDLNDALATNCSSGPPEHSCIAPFAAFGLDHETGSSSGQQSVFKAELIR